MTTGKELFTASKTHSVLTKINKILRPRGGCVDMWLLCQNISRLSFTNPDLPALKYGRTMEMEAANEFFELMKKKHKNLVISECGLFLDKTNCFIGANPDRLMTCDCRGDSCIKIKCRVSINYEKANEKNLDYLYKSDSEIILKTNHSYFTKCILQMVVTNRKLCYFVVCRRVTRGGGEAEISPALFQNLKKSALILGKNALIRFIYRFNFSFKMLF